MSRLQPEAIAKTVAIIGAGLAGAACANTFARAGFQVTVFEQGAKPAEGASGVPLAMFAPSVSSDDAPHSRLLRRGINVLLDELHRLTALGLLQAGTDWACNGVLERCIRGDKKLPSIWLEPKDPVTLQSKILRGASPESLAGHMVVGVQELFHGVAGWVNPAKLIAAWFAHHGITVQTGVQIATLGGMRLQAFDVLVVACGYQTAQLVPDLSNRLQLIRGQVEWGNSIEAIGTEYSPRLVNGMGHWIEGAGKWLTGATFQRDTSSLAVRSKDVDLNFEKLAMLRPHLAPTILARLRETSVSWVGVRTAQKSRAPLIDCMTDPAHQQLWVCAGLGSRGLSLASLCASKLLTAVQHRLALG